MFFNFYVFIIVKYIIWNFIMKKIFFLILLIVAIVFSCKKINILSPVHIPPPTAFPSESDEEASIPDYPNPSPLPLPPEETEEKPIEINPEIVQDGTVFGGFSKRFIYKNEWYVLAANEYKYDPDKKQLNRTGKGAVLKIADDGNTIIKIHSLSPNEDLSKVQYWTNLHSSKLIIDTDRVYIELTNRSYEVPYKDITFEIKPSNFKDTLYDTEYYYEVRTYRHSVSSDTLINWQDSKDIDKIYKLPETNYNNPNNWQGRIGCTRIEIVFFKDKMYAFNRWYSVYDLSPTGYRDPNDKIFTTSDGYYYVNDLNDSSLELKTWTTNQNPFGCRDGYDIKTDGKKLYVTEGVSNWFYYNAPYWGYGVKYFDKSDGIWSTEDGKNWVKETSSANYDAAEYIGDEMIAMSSLPQTPPTPSEPSYTLLNGKYYRTLNLTYPIPPIKEIMETVDKFETNFTITEEHIRKSGSYQLQVSDISPDKAQESDWVSIVPNNDITSFIGWESGGGDLFTFNNKIVRLVDYDREFKLNTQYETALNLSEKYYALLIKAKTMEDYKKYDYYFLYYKSMSDMIKMIKDKGNDYFLPDKAYTHYTFEL